MTTRAAEAKRVRIVGIALAAMISVATSGFGQGIIVQSRIDGPPRIWLGSYQYFPSHGRYARPQHGPSVYQGYGNSRLEGRILALPAGIAPPSSPYGVERYTVARVSAGTPAPSGSVGSVGQVGRAPYYPRESHIRRPLIRSRASHRM